MNERVQQCTDLAVAEALWRRLTSERAPEDVQGTLAGFVAWAACGPGDEPPPLLIASRAGEPLAILPARRASRRVKGIPLRVLEAAGNEHWPLGVPIVGADSEASITALLTGLLGMGGWDVIDLASMRREGQILGLLVEHGRRLGFAPMMGPAVLDPIVRIDGPFSAYYARLSGNLRSQVKRGEAKLARMGPLRFEAHAGGGDLTALLDEFFRIEASGWKRREGTAIADDPSALRFYSELAREAARHGLLRLYALRAGGRCVAADYCIAYGGTVHMLKIGYDESVSHCSPGQVMRKRVLEHLFDTRGFTSPPAPCDVDAYDMMAGGGDHAAYKARWADYMRERLAVRLFNPRSVRGRLAAGVQDLRAWLRELSAPRRTQPAVDIAGGPA